MTKNNNASGNSWQTEHWDKYQAYIRSGGQNPIVREVHLIDHSTELVKRIQELEAELVAADENFHASVNAQDAALTSQINRNAKIAREAIAENELLRKRSAELEDRVVQLWHDRCAEAPTIELHEALGMTWEQYQIWVQR